MDFKDFTFKYIFYQPKVIKFGYELSGDYETNSKPEAHLIKLLHNYHFIRIHNDGMSLVYVPFDIPRSWQDEFLGGIVGQF